MLDFNVVIRDWLNAHPDDRSFEDGAMILLQLTRNQTRYRAMLRNQQAYASVLEDELKAHLAKRENKPSPQEVAAIRKEAAEILAAQTSLKTDNPAKDFKGGKRPDHDSLPPEIQNLYDENTIIRHRMSKYHIEIQNLLKSPAGCAAEDLRDVVALLRDADIKYHENWKAYDSFGKE